MTRTTARLAAALALAPALAAAQARAPEPPRGRPLEYEAAARGLARAGRLEPAGELLERWQYDGRRPFRALTLGSYLKVERHLKVGAFWRLQYGARHDDDWLKDGPGRWSWRDTSRRPEHVLVLDATPRAELAFLPGSWTTALKVRYEHDFFNKQGMLALEPELAWLWMDGLAPRATVFLRHGTHLGLNFGGRRVWQRWWYLAGLWHAAPGWSFGPTVALRDEYWNSSADYRLAAPAGGYRVLYRSVLAGATVVGRWR